MRFPFHSLMRIAQKIIIFCAIFIVINSIINGVALAADRDVIIGFNKPVGPSEKALVQSHGGLVKKSFHLIPAIAARVPENNITKMKKDARIIYIEDDKIYEAADEYTSSWGVRHIGSDIVHSQGIIGTGVKVAILDTGIDYNHEDLNDNYKGGIGFVQDPNGIVNPSNFDDSYNSHGTHVAGIIAAENNGVGVVGVAPNASIYAVKVLDGSTFGYASWIISGIQWAVDNNMDIVTMSIQGSDSQALHDAVDMAYNNSGILLIAAGGNYRGEQLRPVIYPAAYDSVIAVTATDQNDKNASFSPIDSKIELAAPGVNINSTIRGDGYGILSGTSMATPHVTGVAALIYEGNLTDVNGDGKVDGKDVRIILQNTSKDIGEKGRDNIYGFGLVDASNAVLGIPSVGSGPGPLTDLSIVKDDGVSAIVAGDGTIYRYTITVKNNGPSNASGVKVVDTWPTEFIRGNVATSGNCDNINKNINFTCDLGTILKDEIVNITVNYSVLLNAFEVERNYTNKVNVISQTPDSNMGNNNASDTNIVNEAKLPLARTKGPEINDAKNISISQGNYSVKIKNVNLTKVYMVIYENGTIRKDLSSYFKFNKFQEIDKNIYVNNTFNIVFIPYGDKGTIGYVTIRRL